MNHHSGDVFYDHLQSLFRKALTNHRHIYQDISFHCDLEVDGA